jgi:hypothetical protein
MTINPNFYTMKKFRLILVVALLLGGMSTVSAQEYERHNISIHLGGVLPLQEFAANGGHPVFIGAFGDRGYATFGASLGLKYNYIFDFGLGVYAAADGFWNMINKPTSDMYDKVSCTKPMYINVPILAGVNYVTDFSDVIDVWAEAGIGANLFFKTPEGWNDNLIKYQMTASFATGAGVGVTFIDRISIGAHFYWLGNQRIKVKDIDYDETYIVAPRMQTSMMVFKVGFHF